MDRVSLQRLLDEGISLAEIGRRFDRHEATVAYWVRKHGLQAAWRVRHANKAPLSRGDLAPLVAQGLSTSQIAERLGRSKTTIRHWLREHGLETQWASRRRASAEGRQEIVLRCAQHGLVAFRLRGSGGYRCTRARRRPS